MHIRSLTAAFVLLPIMPSSACSSHPGLRAAGPDRPAPAATRPAQAPPTGHATKPRPRRTAPLTHARLTERLRRMVRRAPDAATLDALTKSRDGREIWFLQLARPGKTPPDARTAILIVAGLDATHLVGTETAVGLAESLLDQDQAAGPSTRPATEPVTRPAAKPATSPSAEPATRPATEPATRPAAGARDEASAAPDGAAEHEDLLVEHTVYVLSRINPDGAERFLGSVRLEYDGNTLPTDDDRDGVADDDPPEDLNGDGWITQMRVRDPQEATHFEDPDEPRLLREAKRSEDERPVYKVYLEGIDNDGDGEYNEDGVGGTVPNRNFPHAYTELGDGAGRHPLSEPETRALGDFVVSHPNIAAVIVYGRHDNIVHVPTDKERDVSGRGYRHLHPDDVATYKHLSERFKELTGLEDAPKTDDAGAFHAWAYNQRGLPTFATTLWWLAKPKPPGKSKAGAATQPSTQPTTRPAGPTTQPSPQPKTRPDGMPETRRAAPTTGSAIRPVTTQPAATQPAENQPAEKEVKDKAKKPGKEKDPLEVERRWLKYSDDERGGAGFVPWTSYDHPTLGRVDIGGFAPGFRVNPPADLVSGIVEKQRAFLEDIARRLPRPRVAGYKVTRRSDSVFEIELSMTNDAYFSTALAMAKAAETAYPFVLRLDVPADRLLGGRRVHKIPSIDGLGATEEVRWLVAGREGEEIGLKIYHRRFGTIDTTIRLKDTGEDTEASDDGDEEND